MENKIIFLHAEAKRFVAPLQEIQHNKAGLEQLLVPLSYAPFLADLSDDYSFALPALDDLDRLLLDQIPSQLGQDISYAFPDFLADLTNLLDQLFSSLRNAVDGALENVASGLDDTERDALCEEIFNDIIQLLASTYLQRHYGLLFNLGLFVNLIVAEEATPLTGGTQEIRDGGTYRFRFHHEKVAEFARNTLLMLAPLFTETSSSHEFVDNFLLLMRQKGTALASALLEDIAITIDVKGIAITADGLFGLPAETITFTHDDLATIHLDFLEKIELTPAAVESDGGDTVKLFWKQEPADAQSAGVLRREIGPWILSLPAQGDANGMPTGLQVTRAGDQIELRLYGLCQIAEQNQDPTGDEETILSAEASLTFSFNTNPLTDVTLPRLPTPTLVLQLDEIAFNGANLIHSLGDVSESYAVNFASTSQLRIESRLDPQADISYQIKVALDSFSLLLPLEMVRKAELDDEGALISVSDQQARVTFATATEISSLLQLIVDSDGQVSLNVLASDDQGVANPVITSDSLFIGNPDKLANGLIVKVEQVMFDLDQGERALLQGISIDEATVYLPADLPQVVPDELTLQNFRIDAKGVSLSVTGTWDIDPQTLDPTQPDQGFFGLPGYLSFLSLNIEENRPVAAEISGFIVVPYFDEFAAISIALNAEWDMMVGLSSVNDEGLLLRKEELAALYIQSLIVSKQGNLASIIVSGGLEPLLMASDGLEWPRLDVTDLSIEQDITDLTKPPILKFKEAWLDLKDLATLDLWGFHFELNRVGLGYEEPRDRLWVDLTGSLRLIEQIPVGLGVEGFRLSWPRTIYEMLNIGQVPKPDDLMRIAAQLEVKFDGVYLFFGVPQAVEFEGYIRFIKEAQKIGFAGDVVLRVPASGFSLEAGLMVGMNFAQPYPYPFLYVYLGVELPSGIPLGQSGLALKGALGLFGLNVVPDKTPEQNWYYDWYKRGPFQGAHQTNKWRDEFLALAVGIGVTITTTDGYIKGVRGLLVLAIPGPILIIEGRSLIFDGLLPGEPPLRAMAVFDGRERIIQFNIEAEATLIEDMLDTYGMLEAFFDFKDLTNWHLYLGQDEPRDRRIQANIIKFRDAFLFKADAYLMVDMIGSHTLRSRMGVFVGFKPPIPSFGPVQITLDAVLEGNGVVTVLPEQFSGEIGLSANIKLQAFGFGLQMVAGAGVLTEGPRPLKVDAEVYIKAELPLPFAPVQGFLPEFLDEAIPEIPPLEVEAKLELSWQAPDPPEIVPPLFSITADSPFVPGGGALTIRERQAVNTTWQPEAENSPVVPIDTRPVMAFTHEMNDAAGQSGPAFARYPDGQLKSFEVGFLRFTPTVTAVRLYEQRKGEPWPASLDGWKLAASSQADSPGGEISRLPGVWMTEADPQGPDQPTTRRLHLWSTNPLLHAAKAVGPGYPMLDVMTISQDAPVAQRQSHAEALLGLYPDLQECSHTEPHRICVPFDKAAPTPDRPGQSWSYHHIRFLHDYDGIAAFINTGGTNLLPPPKLDLRSLRLLQRDLVRIEASFARLRPPFGMAQLKRWAGSVSPARQKRIRYQLPQWRQVWEWLWPMVRPARVCLHLSGGMHTFQFPESVRQVWIRFCQPPEVHPANVPNQIEVRRTAHSLEELLAISEEASAKGVPPDYYMCLDWIEHQTEVTEDEWTIIADDAFDCLTLIRMREFTMAEICYLTETEYNRATRASKQCELNDNPPPDENSILEPGSYYRLEVDTFLKGDLIIPPPGVNLDQRIVGMLETLYNDILNQLGLNGTRTYNHVAFFQTEGPPTQLNRYIKWSSPEHQALRVFREHDFSIRFLGSNVKAMFSHLPHELKLQVRSAEGRMIDGYETEWDTAHSASLLHEEQLWRKHTNMSGLPPGDDVLVARRTNARLEPAARYELLVTGGDGGELLFRDRFDAGLLPEIWGINLSGWQVDLAAGKLSRSANSAGSLLTGDPGWTDIDISAEISLPDNTTQWAGLLLRAQETSFPGVEDPIWHGCRLRLRRRSRQPSQLELRLEALRPGASESPVELDRRISMAPNDAWIQLRITLVANHLRVWIYDKLELDGSLNVINDDWTNDNRPAGTFLWVVGGFLDDDHRQALKERRLMPSAQGAIGLFASGSGSGFRRLRVHDAVLHKVNFTTSAFAGFHELVESATSPIDLTVTTMPNDNDDIRTSTPSKAAELARARRDWERGQVDFRFEWINREELEALRLVLREARAGHDAAFRALAEAVSPELYYQPLAPHIDVYHLKNSSNQLIGIWLRSPESLDLRQEVSSGDGSLIGHVGRTSWQLERQTQGDTWSIQAGWQAHHDADGTQVIFLQTNNIPVSGNYQIRFTYHLDHGDENIPDEKHGHWYDRPVERRNGGSDPLESIIDFQV